MFTLERRSSDAYPLYPGQKFETALNAATRYSNKDYDYFDIEEVSYFGLGVNVDCLEDICPV